MRVKRGNIARKRRNKVLKSNKGFIGSQTRLFKVAGKIAYWRSMLHAFFDRRKKKSNFRKLWTQRINAAAREQGITYSRFISGLKNKNINLDRKILAALAVHDKETFKKIVEKVKAA